MRNRVWRFVRRLSGVDLHNWKWVLQIKAEEHGKSLKGRNRLQWNIFLRGDTSYWWTLVTQFSSIWLQQLQCNLIWSHMSHSDWYVSSVLLGKLQMTNSGVVNHFRMIASVDHALKKHGMQDFNARHIKVRVMDLHCTALTCYGLTAPTDKLLGNLLFEDNRCCPAMATNTWIIDTKPNLQRDHVARGGLQIVDTFTKPLEHGCFFRERNRSARSLVEVSSSTSFCISRRKNWFWRWFK